MTEPHFSSSAGSVEAQPVAWRVKNDSGHWYVTQDRALADTYRDVEKKDVQPLYLAAQPATTPVETATGDVLATLVLEYARDLRRNSSGGDDYPWEYAEGTADHLEELVRRHNGAISRPPAPVGTCLHEAIIGPDGKWRCQKCTAAIEMTTAQSNTGQ